MNRANWMGVFSLICIVASTNPAEAQGRGGVSGGWGGVIILLHPEVQKELKLDESQVQKTQALVDEMREKQKTMFATLEGLAGEARDKKAHEVAGAHAEQGIKSLEKLLKPEQFARFQQIDLQQRGIAALTDPKVAQSLKISAEQSEKLGAIVNQSIIRMREAPSRSRGDREATRAMIQAIRKETDAKAVDLLTEDQKLGWKTMTGEPFEMSTATRPVR